MTVERRNVEGLADPPGYSHVAVARGSTLVFTAGAVPLDAAGDLVGPEDPVAQTDQVVANLLAALATAGAGPDDVVKTTVFVAGADHDAQLAVWEVVQASPIAAAPSTLVGVALLGYTGQLVRSKPSPSSTTARPEALDAAAAITLRAIARSSDSHPGRSPSPW